MGTHLFASLLAVAKLASATTPHDPCRATIPDYLEEGHDGSGMTNGNLLAASSVEECCYECSRVMPKCLSAVWDSGNSRCILQGATADADIGLGLADGSGSGHTGQLAMLHVPGYTTLLPSHFACAVTLFQNDDPTMSTSTSPNRAVVIAESTGSFAARPSLDGSVTGVRLMGCPADQFEVILYEDENYKGYSLRLNDSADILPADWQRRVRSVGIWRTGGCVRFPGVYDEGDLNDVGSFDNKPIVTPGTVMTGDECCAICTRETRCTSFAYDVVTGHCFAQGPTRNNAEGKQLSNEQGELNLRFGRTYYTGLSGHLGCGVLLNEGTLDDLEGASGTANAHLFGVGVRSLAAPSFSWDYDDKVSSIFTRGCHPERYEAFVYANTMASSSAGDRYQLTLPSNGEHWPVGLADDAVSALGIYQISRPILYPGYYASGSIGISKGAKSFEDCGFFCREHWPACTSGVMETGGFGCWLQGPSAPADWDLCTIGPLSGLTGQLCVTDNEWRYTAFPDTIGCLIVLHGVPSKTGVWWTNNPKKPSVIVMDSVPDLDVSRAGYSPMNHDMRGCHPDWWRVRLFEQDNFAGNALELHSSRIPNDAYAGGPYSSLQIEPHCRAARIPHGLTATGSDKWANLPVGTTLQRNVHYTANCPAGRTSPAMLLCRFDRQESGNPRWVPAIGCCLNATDPNCQLPPDAILDLLAATPPLIPASVPVHLRTMRRHFAAATPKQTVTTTTEADCAGRCQMAAVDPATRCGGFTFCAATNECRVHHNVVKDEHLSPTTDCEVYEIRPQ